jgi:hypothetical protein
MKISKTTKLPGVFTRAYLAKYLEDADWIPDGTTADSKANWAGTKGRWVVTVEFTPEADLEIEHMCGCAPYKLICDGAWYGPCKDGKHHRFECPVAEMAMKEAKWPCGKLKYPEMSEP